MVILFLLLIFPAVWLIAGIFMYLCVWNGFSNRTRRRYSFGWPVVLLHPNDLIEVSRGAPPKTRAIAWFVDRPRKNS